MTKCKRINAAAMLYKSYLLHGVAPYLNERGGLAVASVFRPVTADVKASVKRDKEALLEFLQAGKISRQLLLTYSKRKQKNVANFLAERLAIITEGEKITDKEIALAWASAVNFFTKWSALTESGKNFVIHHKRENTPSSLENTMSTEKEKMSTL